MNKEKYILHIEIKGSGKHLYSNSLNVLLEKAGDVGISAQSVRNYMSVNKTDVFENEYCVIRKGIYYPMTKPNVAKSKKGTKML